MKIKTKKMSFAQVMALPRPQHKKPLYPSRLLRVLVRLLAIPDLLATRFLHTEADMEKTEGLPCLVLMNHSSFIDLKIAAKLLFPHPYSIVCTCDGFVGKSWLMRWLGCIATRKFLTDATLVSDMKYALRTLKSHVLMYPEASYSFDGCATPLPRRLGVLLKRLDAPVVTIITDGAFLRDPLYNNLQNRAVRVSARMRCLLSRQEVREKSVEELDALLDREFSFDNFARQREKGVEVTEPFRADYLNRILYRCICCGSEGEMTGRGTHLTCRNCGARWELDTLGRLKNLQGDTEEYRHIPQWFAWERDEVRREITEGRYRLDTAVDIGVLVDTKAIYLVGEGRLQHSAEGFHLTGCDGQIDYRRRPDAAYGLYADYNWYELGDVICIGDEDILYYCFPKQCGDVVAKTRFATEELYKLHRAARRRRSEQ